VRERLGLVEEHLRDVLSLDASLREAAEALERAQLELTETGRTLESYVSSLESDPARLAQVESRLAELRRLQTRYGPSIESILAFRDQAREELDAIGGGEARTAALEAARRQCASELEAAMLQELAAVDLRRTSLRVVFEPLAAKTREGWEAPCAPQGRERASFWITANPGEEPRRLRDAASGGELARLLLALRNVLREADRGRVLLFDEIDAGVGGQTARRVGERLRALAGRHQVLCISHLPQIAGLAETHHCVQKRVRGGRTRTHVQRLEGEDRVEEIARMAAGGRVTQTARAHARELLRP
jgi:DNA repair protein RecN (Recombination protein N)